MIHFDWKRPDDRHPEGVIRVSVDYNCEQLNNAIKMVQIFQF